MARPALRNDLLAYDTYPEFLALHSQTSFRFSRSSVNLVVLIDQVGWGAVLLVVEPIVRTPVPLANCSATLGHV